MPKMYMLPAAIDRIATDAVTHMLRDGTDDEARRRPALFEAVKLELESVQGTEWVHVDEKRNVLMPGFSPVALKCGLVFIASPSDFYLDMTPPAILKPSGLVMPR